MVVSPTTGVYVRSHADQLRDRRNIIEVALKASGESERSFVQGSGIPAARRGIIFGSYVHGNIVYKWRTFYYHAKKVLQCPFKHK